MVMIFKKAIHLEIPEYLNAHFAGTLAMLFCLIVQSASDQHTCWGCMGTPRERAALAIQQLGLSAAASLP